MRYGFTPLELIDVKPTHPCELFRIISCLLSTVRFFVAMALHADPC